MPRVVSLFLPRWPTDRLRRKAGAGAPPAEVPLVLAGRDGRRRVVTAADRAACAAGVKVGMAVAKAQALVPGLVVEPADPRADADGLERLALWALERLSPLVAADPPDGLVIDSTGADHLHGGEAAMAAALVRRFAASGVEARAAVAGSWGAAHAVARFARSTPAVIAPGGDAAALVDLPIAALRLDPALVEGLAALGFARIGEIAAAPRAPLVLRFGPEIGRRLDQAFGRLAEPIEPVRPPDLVEVRRSFPEPIGAAETIARAIGALVVRLCAALETRGLGARRLDLLVQRVDNGRQAIRVATALPVRDVRRLTRLLTDRIETIDPGFGIETLALAAPLAEPLAARQTVSALVEAPEPDVSDLVDTLANRVGERGLYRFAPVASDLPERAVARVPALAPAAGATWQGEWPRPPRLLARPEPIETMALLPDHPPVWFSWRGIRRRIRRADGPERLYAEWWTSDAELAAVRDYFRVEDAAGQRYWIFRAGDGEDPATGSHRWFLHGLFA